jgi:hypothetical protein
MNILSLKISFQQRLHSFIRFTKIFRFFGSEKIGTSESKISVKLQNSDARLLPIKV